MNIPALIPFPRLHDLMLETGAAFHPPSNYNVNENQLKHFLLLVEHEVSEAGYFLMANAKTIAEEMKAPKRDPGDNPHHGHIDEEFMRVLILGVIQTRNLVLDPAALWPVAAQQVGEHQWAIVDGRGFPMLYPATEKSWTDWKAGTGIGGRASADRGGAWCPEAPSYFFPFASNDECKAAMALMESLRVTWKEGDEDRERLAVVWKPEVLRELFIAKHGDGTV